MTYDKKKDFFKQSGSCLRILFERKSLMLEILIKIAKVKTFF